MKCRVCGNDKANKDYLVPGTMVGRPGEYSYFMCGSCDCLQIAEFPARYQDGYPDTYHYERPEPRRNAILNRLRKTRDRYALSGRGTTGAWLYRRTPNLYLSNLRPVAPKPSERILEIGCGGGVALNRLVELGFRNVEGVDMGIAADTIHDNGVPIRKGTVQDVDGTYDVIMAVNVMEHVPNPRETIAAAARILAENGTLILQLPLVPSVAWDAYGVHWLQLGAPRHYFLHSAASVRLLAEAASLCVSDVRYNSDLTQFWGSEYNRYAAENGTRKHPRVSRGQLREWRRLSETANANSYGDQATFYLRRSTAGTA